MLNYRYMIIIKIVANIYLALKICRLKKILGISSVVLSMSWKGFDIPVNYQG